LYNIEIIGVLPKTMEPMETALDISPISQEGEDASVWKLRPERR